MAGGSHSRAESSLENGPAQFDGDLPVHALSITLGAAPPALGVAAVFFLAGSVVGLIAMLRAERRSRRAVDDYGLFEARLLATPLLSGLTALAGVVLLAIGPAVLGTDAAGNQATNVTLGDIFSLERNARGLLAAAVFGLAPELLISWLSRDADKVKENLASTEPGGAATPKSNADRS
jgi:hypothetical protein